MFWEILLRRSYGEKLDLPNETTITTLARFEKKNGLELTIDTSTRAFAEVRRGQLRIALQFGKQGIMQFRGFLAGVVLVFAGLSALAEPKAYEVVKYKGKAEGMTFALDDGDGYPHPSEMRVTDRKSGKTTRFGLDDAVKCDFCRQSGAPTKERSS